MATWFAQLVGAPEEYGPDGYARTRALMSVETVPGTDNLQLVAKPNGARYNVGRFSTPTLAELRTEGHAAVAGTANPGVVLHHVPTMDVMADHSLPENKGALFQVASQFNCLEFGDSNVVPERGVTNYIHDNTQGPACALAAAPATIYRNYFAKVGTHDGQTADTQINNLELLERHLDNAKHQYWSVKNGYTFSEVAKLEELNALLKGHANLDSLRAMIAVGVQYAVEVTAKARYGPGALLPKEERSEVAQAFCSAISVSYSGIQGRYWEGLAKLVLEATYEATLWAAAINAKTTGVHKVFLTKVGGGVFGNDREWIIEAIGRACAVLEKAGAKLDVHVQSYRSVSKEESDKIDASFAKHKAH